MTPADQNVWHCPLRAPRAPSRRNLPCGRGRPADADPANPPCNATLPAARPRAARPLLIGLLLGLSVAAIPLWSLWPDSVVHLPGGSPSPEPPDPASTPAVPLEPDTTELAAPSGAPVAQEVEDGWILPAQGLASVISSSTFTALEDVLARALPAVVSIQAGRGRGTGFFIRPDLVLTNAHVVDNQLAVQLTAGDRLFNARVATVSTGSDLALLQVDNPDARLPTLRLGSAKGLRVGQEVIAIGSALGVLSNTATRGIVSASRDTGTVTLIQTDAAINPGNSGGPLVDRAGVVIGVNSMRIAAAQGGEGLAFAVAIDHAVQLLDGQLTRTDATPLQGLNRLMGGASTSGDMREQGTQAYQKALQDAARRSDDIDTFWDRYAGHCITSVAHSGDRLWFAVYEPDGLHIVGTSGYDCKTWLGTLRTNAEIIRAEVARATEAARRQGVYPGVMRDLRRKHRMEWRGWER